MTDDWELQLCEGIAEAVDRADVEGNEPDNAALGQLPLNDLGNARRLLARFGGDLRYSDEIGWLAWDGKRWSDAEGEAYALKAAHKVVDAIAGEAAATPARGRELRAWARKSGGSGHILGMLRHAQPYLRLTWADFNRDPRALNVQNGTLRLDGEVRLLPHKRADLISRVADVTYAPEADCPRWRRFIADVQPEADVQLFLQIWLGYCLSGLITEQRIAIFEGQGSNGKSTLIDVVAKILGGYAASCPVETWLHAEHKSGSGPSPDLARLPGARLVRTSEPEPGARLSESVIKQWTGGEPITARKLNRDFFDFTPVGKLTMSVNAKPVVVGKDFGIRRRLLVVPFTQRFERQPGRDLTAELLEERSGILNWLLDGWRLYQEEGLRIPAVVVAATERYFAENDPIGQFVLEACTAAADASESASVLYQGYRKWCEASSEEPRKLTPFGRRLTDLGFPSVRLGKDGRKVRQGLRLNREWWPSAEVD